MNEDETAKQAYLFEEIINKNFNPLKFQEFIVSQREGGDDLENWSLKEL
jgi:hypothetical protein